MRSLTLLMLLAVTGGFAPLVALADDAAFAAAAHQLTADGFDAKAEAVTKIAQVRAAGSKPLLAALLDGRVFFRKSDQHVFVVKGADGDPLVLVDPVTQAAAGTGTREDFTKVTTNNRLRKT